MKAYVLCIFTSLILDVIAEYFLNHKKKKYGLFFLALSLFVVCYIAGVRSIYCGTDVRGYVTRLTSIALNHSLIDYITMPDSHLLFGVVVYIGYLFKDYNILLFIIELAVALPIYVYAYKEKDNISLSMTLMAFMLVMYCTSFNLIRQSIAISFCVLSYYFYKKKKVRTVVILILVAAMFHKTALIFVAIYILRYVLEKKSVNKVYLIMFIMAATLIFIVFADRIIGLTSYKFYLNNVDYMREFSIGSIIKRLFWVLISISLLRVISSKSFIKVDTEMSLYMFIYTVLFTIMSFYIPGMGRLGYYFYDFGVFLIIPGFIRLIRPRRIAYLIFFFILFVFWWNMTCVPNDSSGVYPYMSEIANFLN